MTVLRAFRAPLGSFGASEGHFGPQVRIQGSSGVSGAGSGLGVPISHGEARGLGPNRMVARALGSHTIF